MMNTPGKPGYPYAARRQSGLSLVELMISLTIGLILLAGITTLIVQQSTTRREMEKSSRQIENGRYAMEILRNDIEHAGFYGEYAPPITAAYAVPANPCNTAWANQGWNATTSPVTVPVPIQGYAGAATDPTALSACLPNYMANTAVLVVRRTASDTVQVASLPLVPPVPPANPPIFLQVSRCNTDADPFLLGVGGFILRQKDCATPALLHRYIVRIYYVSSCSIVCAGAGDGIPTLKMVEFINGALSDPPIPLVEGIENLQFDYGVDANNDGAPDNYFAANGVANWANVMAVRVNLLARNNETTPGHTDTKSYTLGGTALGVLGGAYKRHIYSQVVRAINPSGRRELP